MGVLARVASTTFCHRFGAADWARSFSRVSANRKSLIAVTFFCSSRGVRSWFDAHGQLETQRAQYRMSGSFPYLAPREGFTITDYLLARHLGGVPIQAGYSLTQRDFAPAEVHSGEVILATLDDEPGDDTGHLLRAVRRLERSGLGVSSVQRLSGRGLTS